MDLVQYVYDTLSPLGYPVDWQLRPKQPPCLSYHFFNEEPELFGNGEELIRSISCQIDIWSKGNYSSIKEEVITAMKAGGFLFAPSPSDTYEEDAKLFHCVLIFNYYFEPEEG